MSVTATKVKRLFHNQGVGGVVRRGSVQLANWLSAWRGVRRHGAMNPDEAIDFAFHRFGGFIRPTQVRSEISSLLRTLENVRPKYILEIGTANGGTLFLLTRIAAPDAILVSVDLPNGDFGDGYPVWKMPLYRSFAINGQQVKLIRDDSHAQHTVDAVRDAVNGNPLDFLFIDGDHTFDGVKRDFDMYAPLVRPGGWVGFHDMAPHAPDVGCEVRRFWDEIKYKYHHLEFVEDPAQGWGGIGLLQLPDGQTQQNHVRQHD